MAEFANETGDMVRDVLAERAMTAEADGPTFAHLSDVTVTRAEMNRIADADDAWTTVSVKGGVGWHNTDTDEVVFAGTPEGVPEDYVYVPPAEEIGDEYDVVESPRGATYRSPEPVGEDDGYVPGDARDFVTETGPDIEFAEDFESASEWVDGPSSIESVDVGDKLGITHPQTFQFESAVVKSVDEDAGTMTVLSSDSYDPGSTDTVEMSIRDVLASYNDAGDEFAQQRQADLKTQIRGTDKETLRNALPRDTGSFYGEQILADDFDERFADVDMSDTDAVVENLRELIQENDNHYAIELSSSLDEISNRLAAQGRHPDRDGVTGYEVDLPDGNDFRASLDEVFDHDFDDDHERAIATQRLIEDRTDFGGDLEVPSVNEESQRDYAQAVKMADETGILEPLAHSVHTVPEGTRGDSFAFYDGVKVKVKDNITTQDVKEHEETSMSSNTGEVLIHELGHANHDEERGGLPPAQVLGEMGIDTDLVEDEVSKYAASNELEFVAEVFLGQIKGEDFSDEILDYYNEVSGPTIPDSARGALGAETLSDEEAQEASDTDPDDEDFDTYRECIDVNSDKDDPESYCAVIFGFDDPADDDEVEGELRTDGGQDMNEQDKENDIAERIKENAPDDLPAEWLEEAIAVAVEVTGSEPDE
jgi:hypothetical protein